MWSHFFLSWLNRAVFFRMNIEIQKEVRTNKKAEKTWPFKLKLKGESDYSWQLKTYENTNIYNKRIKPLMCENTISHKCTLLQILELSLSKRNKGNHVNFKNKVSNRTGKEKNKKSDYVKWHNFFSFTKGRIWWCGIMYLNYTMYNKMPWKKWWRKKAVKYYFMSFFGCCRCCS